MMIFTIVGIIMYLKRQLAVLYKTPRPANPEVLGLSEARGLGLSHSQRLGTRLLLGHREVML